jgi:hypothetical protein
VIDNRRITTATVKANKQLLWANKISYIQAYCTIQALLVEIDSDESACFAKFPVYIEQYKAVHPQHHADLKLSPQGNFEAVYFCPAGCRRACAQIRPLLAVDSTHTRSKYRIQLLVAIGIDANNNGMPIVWALVPIENKYWWTWFLENLRNSAPITTSNNYIFISDREKGLAPAIEEVFPKAFHAYCCQYIADNIQTQFGIKYRSLFWACARAKTQTAFDKLLKERQFTNLPPTKLKLFTTSFYHSFAPTL